MRIVNIEHPLRTIVLQYDEAKPETDYEKQLVQAHVELHHQAAKLKQQQAKLIYDFGLFDEQIEQAEKVFEPIAKTINNFLQQASAANNDDEANAVTEQMHSFHKESIANFHPEIVDPLAALCNTIQLDFEEYEKALDQLSENYNKHQHETCKSLYSNYDAYALDLNSYDDDIQELAGILDALDIYRQHTKVIDRYNALMDCMQKSYAQWDETKEVLNRVYDDEGLLDSSLSKSFESKEADKSLAPLYVIPPGDKRIETFKLNYGMLARSSSKTLSLAVPIEVIKSLQTAMLQEMIITLQHFPKMIEKWIFAIEIVITDHDKRELTEDEWKGHPLALRWYHRLCTLPCIIFFLQDHDARHYALMGDLVADGKLTPADNGGLLVEGEMLQEVQNRLFNACLFFMLYCHNTGFDPEPYVEALMSDFNAMFSYEELKEQYLQNVASGVQLQAVPVKN